MSIFNRNKWYHIYTGAVNGDNGDHKSNATTLLGTSLFNKTTGKGSSFFKAANITEPYQQWQIYPIDSDYFVLRTRDSGQNGFLATQEDVNAKVPSGITAAMVRGNITDESVYWQIKPWDDGYYYLTNKKDGSGLHLSNIGKQSVM
jgi:hypothetical protein